MANKEGKLKGFWWIVCRHFITRLHLRPFNAYLDCMFLGMSFLKLGHEVLIPGIQFIELYRHIQQTLNININHYTTVHW